LPQSIVSVLAAGEDGLAQVAALAADVATAAPAEQAALRASGRLLPFAGTALLPPVRRPGLVLMLESLAEPLAGAWIKSPNTAVGPDARVGLPSAGGDRLAVAARLALVVGRPLFGDGAERAARAYAGVTLLADLAAPGRGAPVDRQFPGAGPLGPLIATPDELAPSLRLESRINGHVVAAVDVPVDAATAARLLAAVATAYALRPGDLVVLPPASALPSAGRGDRVTVGVAGVAELRFTVG
jgi:2-keto-4-pentenoate hydratase/2-oxohepta-3-ene-1,7-dioic acid hydratase in catechol pathway